MKKVNFDLGTEHIAATLGYRAPEEAPAAGAEWDDEGDYPGVCAILTTPGSYLDESLRGQHSIAGSEASVCWGNGAYWACGVYTRRLLQKTFRAPTLASAEAKAREWLTTVKAEISIIVGRREVRLAKRAATIAAAHAAHGEITDTD